MRSSFTACFPTLAGPAYRSDDHQPVIPIDAAHDARSDVETQSEDYGTERQGGDFHDGESRTSSRRVDVVRLRPSGQHLGGRRPHVGRELGMVLSGTLGCAGARELDRGRVFTASWPHQLPKRSVKFFADSCVLALRICTFAWPCCGARKWNHAWRRRRGQNCNPR